MCAVAKMISGQISFAPLDSKDYGEDIHRVLDRIKASGLEYSIGSMSTFVRGEKKQVFQLIDAIFTDRENHGPFVMDVKLSNVCGCD